MAFKIKKNDTGPKLSLTLQDAAGSAIDVSGATLRFHMKAYGATTLKVDAAATIVDADDGKVEYAWQTGDTDTAGTFYGEIEVTYGDSTVETFPNNSYFTIIIQEDLD